MERPGCQGTCNQERQCKYLFICFFCLFHFMWKCAQELTSILEQIPGLQRPEQEAGAKGRGPAKGTKRQRAQPDAADLDNDPDAVQNQSAAPSIQTFVFSATLTLPPSLRKRLRKGEPASVWSLCCGGAFHHWVLPSLF